MQPIDVLLTGVCAAEPVRELLAECHAELTEPLVVGEALARPDGAGMARVADGEVAVL